MSAVRKTVTVPPGIVIRLFVSGNLTVKGWSRGELQATSTEESTLEITTNQDGISLACDQDCYVRLPEGADLQIISAEGSAKVIACHGEIRALRVSGNLHLKRVGPATIERLAGNLSAHDLDDDLQIGYVAGNAQLSHINGAVHFEQPLGGNLLLQDVLGDVSGAVQGNASLSLDPQIGQKIELTAEGHLHCQLPPQADALIEIQRAARVSVTLPEITAQEKHNGSQTIQLGEGAAYLTFSVGGNLTLSTPLDKESKADAFIFDFHLPVNFTQDLSQQINQHISRLEQQFESQISQISQALETAQISSERAAEIEARVRRKMEKAKERLARRLAQAERRAEERAWREQRRKRPPRATRRSTRQTPSAKKTPSKEELRLILEMLRDEKITLEEANQLIKALQGDD